MKVLIVEDETLTAEHFERLLKSYSTEIQVLDRVDSYKNACSWFAQNEQPDLLFLDIELGDGTAFDLLDQVKIESPIVFTTAYDAFAVKAFQYNSLHYLLKPITKSSLSEAMQKVEGAMEQQMEVVKVEQLKRVFRQEFKKRFMVKIGEQYKHISVDEIAHFRFDGGFALATTIQNKEFPLDYSLDQLEEILNPMDFFRVNRKIIAHIQSIQNIHTYFNSRLLIQLSPSIKEDIIVSRDRVSNFKSWLDL